MEKEELLRSTDWLSEWATSSARCQRREEEEGTAKWIEMKNMAENVIVCVWVCGDAHGTQCHSPPYVTSSHTIPCRRRCSTTKYKCTNDAFGVRGHKFPHQRCRVLHHCLALSMCDRTNKSRATKRIANNVKEMKRKEKTSKKSRC